MKWFKIYATELLNDTKLRQLTDDELGKWLKLMCHAAKSPIKGSLYLLPEVPMDDKTIVDILQIPDRNLTRRSKIGVVFVNKLLQLGICKRDKQGGLFFPNWRKYQSKWEQIKHLPSQQSTKIPTTKPTEIPTHKEVEIEERNLISNNILCKFQEKYVSIGPSVFQTIKSLPVKDEQDIKIVDNVLEKYALSYNPQYCLAVILSSLNEKRHREAQEIEIKKEREEKKEALKKYLSSWPK